MASLPKMLVEKAQQSLLIYIDLIHQVRGLYGESIARSGNQSECAISRVLPAHELSHIIIGISMYNTSE